MRLTKTLSEPRFIALRPRVLAGCCVPLLGVGLSRRYLLNLYMGAWTRTPPRSSGALARFFPDNIGLTSV